MMLAAPPRANTGAFEPKIAVAIAATARDNFRDVFMPSSLLRRRPITGFAEKSIFRPGRSESGGQRLPYGTYAAVNVSVTQLKRGEFVMASAHCAGMTLQLVRPDIRQSCILLAPV